MPEAYIVRFKVLKVESAELQDGRQYTVAYRRGETSRSSPCYVAEGGVVDFSAMPEGAAIVHFKSGGPRFLPKWITIRLEEYVRGRPRRVVGETQVDCAELLGLHSLTASARRRVMFEINGSPAQMVVALLVYPEKHPALSFGDVAPAAAKEDSAGGERSGEIKRMTRGEAMTLLISLEAMLERRREGGEPAGSAASPLERRLAELEERRRSLAGVEGMAAAVVKQRVEGVVGAQFLAFSRRHRANYVGEVAAYLRQLALTSGLPLTADISEAAVTDTEGARERLQRINTRIDALTGQVRTLEEQQQSLGRLQGRTDVTNELCAIQNKVEGLQSQIALLLKTRAALEGLVRGKGTEATPVGREVQEIRQRLRALAAEEAQLQEQVRRMMNVAGTHVLKWARSKNPPTEDTFTDLATLLAAEPSQAQKQETASQKELGAVERQQLIEALSNAAKPAAPPEKPAASSGAAGPARPQKEEMLGAKGLPSVGDFGGSATKEEAEKAAATPKEAKVAEKHVDPFMSDLRSDMFAPSPPKEPETKKPKLPEFDFGAPLDEDADAGLTQAAAGGGYAIFSMDAHETEPHPAAPPVVEVVAVDDDFMYDFRPTAAAGAKPFTIEFEDPSFFNGLEEGAAAKTPALTFDSGSPHLRDTSSSSTRQLPAYNFGPDSTPKESTTKSSSQLPKYDFGS
ncbi:uncharacterized protein Tco025E_09002 [Trypanosoma conorhini]|uniref:C2 NT-type domain-containing protein n=1 Tax=Trypanosoma conorhini TaxID=83891 RepID=A0A3R7K2N1_9TRYP|nr:uncharacterized protein Tco025E_09002 [Trypanosoma conorhini]RNE99455.1 hypothetical protein Tco025E_09002 [Trypanosoma conorhini]